MYNDSWDKYKREKTVSQEHTTRHDLLWGTGEDSPKEVVFGLGRIWLWLSNTKQFLKQVTVSIAYKIWLHYILSKSSSKIPQTKWKDKSKTRTGYCNVWGWQKVTFQIYRESLQINKNRPKCIKGWTEDRNKPFT